MVAKGLKPKIADLGTGTGAIALALLHECPEAEALGIDISEDALKTATGNAERNGLGSRFRTRSGPWFDQTPERFDVIVSNPPYIRSDVVAGLEPEVTKFDPMAALDGGSDGLDALSRHCRASGRTSRSSRPYRSRNRFRQRHDVTQIFEQSGFSLIEERRDYGDNDRVSRVCRESLISPFAAAAKDNCRKARKRLGFPDEA
ncbi:hypothetical protein KSW81_001146 [Nannochloris sp. 'desiccata']|nr:hypothetical protein KSW81_001146 [Chlorella desiccata (nom. nud.)]